MLRTMCESWQLFNCTVIISVTKRDEMPYRITNSNITVYKCYYLQLHVLQENTDTSLELSNPDETWSPPKNVASQGSKGGRASTGKRRGVGRAKGIGRASRVERESEEVEVGSAARGRARGRQRRATRGRHTARGRGNTASSLSEEDRLRVDRLQEERRLITQVSVDILSSALERFCIC